MPIRKATGGDPFCAAMVSVTGSKHLEDPTVRHKRVDGMRAGVLGALALVLALQGSRIWAETQVYKSIDAKGQITYGDAPSPGAVAVEDLGVTAPDPVVSEEELQKRIDRVAATTDRLRDDRLQREKAQAAARPPAAPRLPAVSEPGYASEPVGYAPFWYRGHNRYVHPHRVPFAIDIHGHGDDFHYGGSAGHRSGRGHGGYDDRGQLPGAAAPRAPQRKPSLLHSSR
ncbi:MAG: DUF4124 domain-containing protein [Gammaproteobacteria bacterium]|nr:DUF4124 domain-containing protein [Gammaproteobacteria bacterium]